MSDIERLRNGVAEYTDGIAAVCKTKPTLTDEERQLFVRLEERFESLAHFFDTPSGVNRKAKEACDRDRRILKSLAERLA